MPNDSTQYMVDFSLPTVLDQEFLSLIPRQRTIVNRLFSEGKLINYALSLENSKLWAVFNADSEADLLEAVSLLPLSKYMKVKISELNFFNAAPTLPVSFSIN